MMEIKEDEIERGIITVPDSTEFKLPKNYSMQFMDLEKERSKNSILTNLLHMQNESMKMNDDENNEDEEEEFEEDIIAPVYATSCCCGVAKLDDNNSEIKYLRVKPRFDVSIIDMIHTIMEYSRVYRDDEEIYRMREKINIGKKELDLDEETWGEYNEEYKEVVRLMNVKSSISKGKIKEYSIDMAMLFECYIRCKLKKGIQGKESWEIESCEYRKGKANNGETGHKQVLCNKKGTSKMYIKGNIIPDIVLKYRTENGERYRYVILDAKYKAAANRAVDQARMDRFQLLAYAYMYDAYIVGFVFPEEKERCDQYTINKFEKTEKRNDRNRSVYFELADKYNFFTFINECERMFNNMEKGLKDDH